MITYSFTDEEGNGLYQEVRRETPDGKEIFYRRPDGHGGWINNLDGVRRVPYRLHGIVNSTEAILWVEGPKDAETLIRLGFLATTCAHGANGWRPEYAEYFRGRCVYALRDNDAPGLKLREAMERDTVPLAKRVHRVELPGVAEGEDVTDWFEAGHTPEEFRSLLSEARPVPVSLSGAVAVESVRARADQARGERPPSVAEPVLPPFPEAAWTGLFAEYRDLVGPTTEAPDSLHWATLCVTLGLLIGRDRFLTTPHPLYPNSFILVVGATGDVRKSTALEYGQEIWTLLEANIRLATGVVSAEGIYDILAEKEGTRLLIFEDELRNLFAAAQRPGTRNLLSQLCSLHRCPHTARITRRESTEAKLPVVSLIGATTPRWISAGLEEEAVFGGFFNRCLVITGEPKPYVAHPEPPARERLEQFAQPLRELQACLGLGPRRMIFSPEAHGRWSEWYVGWRERRKGWLEEHQALTRRTEDHIRKVALLYACVGGRDVIALEDLQRGIAIGEHCETLTLRLLGGITLPRATRLQERILSLIPPEGIPRRDVQQRIGGNYTREEFARSLGILEELGEIEDVACDATRGPGGRLLKRL